MNKNIIQSLGIVISNSVINGILDKIVNLEMEKTQGQYKAEKQLEQKSLQKLAVN